MEGMQEAVSNSDRLKEELSTENLLNLVKNGLDIKETCHSVAEGIQHGTLTLIVVTEKLQHLLTNEDITLRRGGVDILATVLEELPDDYLNDQEIIFLIDFFCCRLSDHHSFIPSTLRGLLALVKKRALPDNVVSKIFTTLNLNFTCQSQLQSDRYTCYQLFHIMMFRKPTELLKLGPDFVCGYLSVIDSERDPRNLMFIFENLPNFYQQFPPGHLLEDAFEAAACYFPIDFRMNPAQPKAISREDLSDALIPCFTAIEDFCSLAVALALDKLSSDVKVAKFDSLALLKFCFIKFSPEKLCPLVDEIVSALMNELNAVDADVELQDLCVDILAFVIRYLSDNKKFDSLSKTLTDIFSRINHFLSDPKASFFISKIKFVAKLAFASSSASQFIVIRMIPKLLSFPSFNNSEILIVLESFRILLKSCVFYNINCADLVGLENIWPEVPQMFLSYCKTDRTELKSATIEAVCSIIQLFNQDQRHFLYCLLCKMVMKELDANIRQKCANSLRTISEIYPEEIKIVLSNEIKISEHDSTNETETKKRIFQCWCTLAPTPGFLTYLDQSTKLYIANNKYENVTFVIEFLRDLITSEKENTVFLSALHHETGLITFLMDWWHSGCNAISDDVEDVFEDESVAQNLQFIITVVIRVLDQKSQQEIAARYFELTSDCSKKFMNSFQYLRINEDLSAPKVHCSLSIVTFEGIVNGIFPVVLTVSLHQYLNQILKYLATLSVYCSRSICCLVACRSVATVLNKIEKESSLIEQISYLKEYIINTLKRNGLLKKNALSLLIYIVKSLLFRGYADLNSWCDLLLSLIIDEEIGNDIADGFRLLFQEDNYFLSESSHGTVRLFFRQRLFSYTVPKLVETAKVSEKSVRMRCAVCTVNLLQGTPQKVIAFHFKQIIPLLVEILNTKVKSEYVYVTLEKLSAIILENAAIFEDYIETFISILLPLAQESSSMKVRIAALECLFKYGKLNPIIVLPFKTRVILGLNKCLDDPKRLVRQQAVKAKIRWTVLDS